MGGCLGDEGERRGDGVYVIELIFMMGVARRMGHVWDGITGDRKGRPYGRENGRCIGA
jgi:hypothetical protein